MEVCGEDKKGEAMLRPFVFFTLNRFTPYELHPYSPAATTTAAAMPLEWVRQADL